MKNTETRPIGMCIHNTHDISGLMMFKIGTVCFISSTSDGLYKLESAGRYIYVAKKEAKSNVRILDI